MQWNDLSMSDKSRMMRLAINSGITDLRTIRDVYNSYAEGGPVKNYKNWREQIERYKNIDTDDPDYDYEGFYNENPIRAWQMLEDNPKVHFTDKYKTESHPTLSNESIYANGRGGTWGEGTFELSDYLMQNSDRTLDYLRRNDPDIIPTYQGGIVLNSAGIADSFAEGGKIHIKPENRGKFTELKKRTGHSASWFKENGTPAQRKMATFALNARKWHHADGGYLFEEGGDTTEQIPQEEMTSQSRPSFGERIKNLNKKLWKLVPATSGLTLPLAAFSSGLYGGAKLAGKALDSVVGNLNTKSDIENEAVQQSNKEIEQPIEKRPLSFYVQNYPEKYDWLVKMSPEAIDRYYFIDDNNKIQSSWPSNRYRSRAKEVKNTGDIIPWDDSREIMLTTDRLKYRTGRISTSLLDYLYDNAAKTKIPFKEVLGLAGKESTLGIGRGYKRGQPISAINLFSYWNGVGDAIKTNSEMNKLYKVYEDLYNGKRVSTERLNATDAEFEELYNKLHEYKGTNIVKDAYDYYKSGNYNPGDPDYARSVLEHGEVLLEDPAIKKWLKGKKSYENRGF